MKKSQQLVSGFVILCISAIAHSVSGQTLVLTENFSGFSAGTHSTPSTSDVSLTLDLKTAISGWTGSMIYPAGGEIKIGTGSVTGWIETPPIDLSGNGGNFTLSFDICRWTSDATTVQVYLNGAPLGNVITPIDQFQQVQINGSAGTGNSKIKIQALTKRFYIDNLAISTEISTGPDPTCYDVEAIIIYPVPAKYEINVIHKLNLNLIEIRDISGKVVLKQQIESIGNFNINVSNLKQGIYFIRFKSDKSIIVRKFIKS